MKPVVTLENWNLYTSKKGVLCIKGEVADDPSGMRGCPVNFQSVRLDPQTKTFSSSQAIIILRGL